MPEPAFTRHRDFLRDLALSDCPMCDGAGQRLFEGTWIDCECIRRKRPPPPATGDHSPQPKL